MSHTLFMGTHLPTIRTGATIKMDMLAKFNPEAEVIINPNEKKLTMKTIEPTNNVSLTTIFCTFRNLYKSDD